MGYDTMDSIKTCFVQSEICDGAVPRYRCHICSHPVCRRCSSRRIWNGARRVLCNNCQVEIDGDDRRVQARIARVKDGFNGQALSLEGKVFGKLRVEKPSGTTAAGDRLWSVACACGKEFNVRATLLYKGKKTSCGCDSDGQVRHGKRGERIYHIWQWLKRSGQLADEWSKFDRFYEAVGDPPGEDLTIAPLVKGEKVGPQGFYWVSSRRRYRRRRNQKGRQVSMPATAEESSWTSASTPS